METGPPIKLWVSPTSRKKKKGNLKRRQVQNKKQGEWGKRRQLFQGEKWSAVTITVGRSKKIKIKNVQWTYQQKLVSDLGKNSYNGQSKSPQLP